VTRSKAFIKANNERLFNKEKAQVANTYGNVVNSSGFINNKERAALLDTKKQKALARLARANGQSIFTTGTNKPRDPNFASKFFPNPQKFGKETNTKFWPGGSSDGNGNFKPNSDTYEMPPMSVIPVPIHSDRDNEDIYPSHNLPKDVKDAMHQKDKDGNGNATKKSDTSSKGRTLGGTSTKTHINALSQVLNSDKLSAISNSQIKAGSQQHNPHNPQAHHSNPPSHSVSHHSNTPLHQQIAQPQEVKQEVKSHHTPVHHSLHKDQKARTVIHNSQHNSQDSKVKTSPTKNVTNPGFHNSSHNSSHHNSSDKHSSDKAGTAISKTGPAHHNTTPPHNPSHHSDNKPKTPSPVRHEKPAKTSFSNPPHQMEKPKQLPPPHQIEKAKTHGSLPTHSNHSSHSTSHENSKNS